MTFQFWLISVIATGILKFGQNFQKYGHIASCNLSAPFTDDFEMWCPSWMHHLNVNFSLQNKYKIQVFTES